MTDKHTRGPWEALDIGTGPKGNQLWTIVSECHDGGLAQVLPALDISEADATLIAAAPDLLKALRDVAKHFDTIEVRRAIDKAQGGT